MDIVFKPIIFIAFVAISSCNKSEDDPKQCYECITYAVKTFKNGDIEKDTILMYPCQTKSFIDAFLKNGNGESETMDIIKVNGKNDTIYYHYKATTICNKR